MPAQLSPTADCPVAANVRANIYRERQQRGWNLAALARQTRQSPATVALHSTGGRGITLKAVGKYAAAFGIKAALLLEDPAEGACYTCGGRPAEGHTCNRCHTTGPDPEPLHTGSPVT